MKKPFATEHELTRLRVGDVVELQGREHVVEMCNSTRAHCVPLARKEVAIETRFGRKVSFTTAENGLDISPNSELEIKRRILN
jgi:hypothetical protein